MVRTLAPFAEANHDDLKTFLNKLKPLGQTPYYYAITQAIRDFDRPAAGVNRHLIVITDGKNFQVAGYGVPATPPGILVEKTADVKQALDSWVQRHPNESLSVDVIGFQTEEKEHDLIKDSQSWRVPVRFTPASNRAQLVRSLREKLGLRRYHVETSAGPYETVDLGKPAILDREPATTVEARVVVDRESPSVDRGSQFATCTLDRGQWLEYDLKPRGLELRSYVREELASAVARDPGSNLNYRVVAHLTDRTGNEVEFPISLQCEDRSRVTRRPTESWVEIRPRGQLTPVFRFYDPPLEDQRPVPVLRCRVPQWGREQRKQAEIQLFCKFTQTTEPQQQILVGSAFNNPIPFTPVGKLQVWIRKQRLKDQTGFAVEVVEDYSLVEGNELRQLKVEMFEPPKTSREEIDTASRLIRHTFVYSEITEQEVNRRVVRLTSRRQLEKGALTLSEPLVVDVE
ncbi:MAG: hypothetical protein HY000_13540 [Planctomycetes bacterium]|nr:hypothetical protein [Planctomycetota bacterium]